MQSLLLTKVSRLRKAPRIANNFGKQKFKSNNSNSSNFDAQGSYTGVNPYDKYEKPIQDADDL